MNHAPARPSHTVNLPAFLKVGSVCLRASPTCRVSGFERYDAARHLPGCVTGSVNITIPDASTHFQYDLQGNLIQVTDGEGQLTQLTYNRLGQPVQVTDARGHVWTTTYDAKGHELTRTNPLHQTVTTVWNKAGDRLSQTDAGGHTTTYATDAAGRITRITNALGHTRRQDYDAAGRPTAQRNEAGQTTLEVTYDLAGRLTQSRDGNGNTIAYGYGEGSAITPLSIQYPGFKRQLAYDARQRTTEIKDILSDALSYSTKQSYDAKGNLTTLTDRNGKLTQLAYDGLGRLVQVTDPASGITRYTYDQRDNLIAVTDANGHTTQYTYDKVDRRTAETRPLGQTQTYAYDEAGNLTRTQDAQGNRLDYTYNDANRRVEEKHTPVGSQTPTRTITYTYNPVGSLTGYTDSNSTNGHMLAHSATYILDALQRKTQETVTLGANSYSTTLTWTPTGQKASQTSPGNLKAEYGYDTAQQLASVSLPTGTLTIADRQWTAPKKITFPGGSVQSREYDGLLRPTRIKVSDPGQSTLIDRQYSFDPESNITKKATEHGDYTYGYDDLYRLTTVDSPSGLPDEGWTYDKLGNRLTDQNRGTPLFGSPSPWTYNANNQLIQSYTTDGEAITHSYDENGSLTQQTSPSGEATDNQRYVYDAQNRLVEVQDSTGATLAVYQYDPYGRRIAKTTRQAQTGVTSTTTYLYSDEGLIGEATATGSLAVEYGWQPGNLWGTDPLYIRTTKTNGADPEVFYYQNDHLGTPQVIVDQAGNIVWNAKALAFGETTVSTEASITNNLRFPGQYYDAETSTHYNFFRDYDPSTGRYVESDPIGLEGGINIYVYVGGNPLRWDDSLGLARIITPGFKNFSEEMAWRRKYKDLYDMNNFVREEIKRKCPNLLPRFDNWIIYPDTNIDNPLKRGRMEATTKGSSTQFNFGWFNQTPSDPGQYFIFMHEFRHVSPINDALSSPSDFGQVVAGKPNNSSYEQDADEWAKKFIEGKCGCD
jgi:RHS repeat-associated protein